MDTSFIPNTSDNLDILIYNNSNDIILIMQISDNNTTFKYFHEILNKYISDKLFKCITVTTAHISISVVNEHIFNIFLTASTFL